MTGPWWAYATLGLFGGVLVMVFVWALCGIASETDRQMDIEEMTDDQQCGR